MNADRKKTVRAIRVDPRLSAAVLAVLLLPGCGTKNFLNENDKLRARVMELETQLKEAQVRADSAEKRLEVAEQSDPKADALPDGVHAPATSRVEIVSPSRGCDTDHDGKEDAVRLYLATYDQRGRFLPTVATVGVTVAAVPAGKEAVTTATHEFDAKALDEAYRSGFGGTHYTLVVPLTQPVPEGVDKLTVTVKLTDLLTGVSHEAEKIVNVQMVK